MNTTAKETSMQTMIPAEMVREFHEAFSLPVATEPAWPGNEALVSLRLRLIEEEAAELLEAVEAGDRVRVASEAADLVYVAYGTAWTFGVAEYVTEKAHTPWFTIAAFLDLDADVEFFRSWLSSKRTDRVRASMACLVADAYEAASRFDVGRATLDAVIAEVHAANMRKLGADGKPILRADGKVTKPENWVGPDVARALGVPA